jgi:putative copper export protein
MITQKGEQRIKPKARNTNKQNSSAWMWVRDHIVVEIIVGVVVALLVAVIIRGC